jgi:hypothetical protein
MGLRKAALAGGGRRDRQTGRLGEGAIWAGSAGGNGDGR